jgi:copper chaperone CopZ
MNERLANGPWKALIPGVLFFLAVTVVLSFARSQKAEEPLKEISKKPTVQAGIAANTDTLSKVILMVEGMTCSGCIQTIESSLSGFKGIGEIFVDLSAGKAEVYYDSEELKDVTEMAAAITANGYPAKVDQVVSPEEVKKERELVAARSRLHIASVGNVDILRKEFDSELSRAKSRYEHVYGKEVFSPPRGRALEDNLKAQIASYLVDETIQLYEIRAAGYKLDQERLDQAFGQFLNQKDTTEADFKASLEKNGYSMEQFMKRFERRALIQSYLDDQVFNGLSDKIQRKQRYSDWFGNAKLLAKVVYYDKEIESLVKNKAAGCGGCGSSGQKTRPPSPRTQ